MYGFFKAPFDGEYNFSVTAAYPQAEVYINQIPEDTNVMNQIKIISICSSFSFRDPWLSGDYRACDKYFSI